MKKLGLLTIPLLLSLISCNNVEVIKIKKNNDLTQVKEESEKYENIFLDDRIPDQWSNYGIGDPFIYRFNGYYYLLCSTKAQNYGVKGWKSKDLMHWEKVNNGISKEGFVVDPSVKQSFDAYASEVYYLDGTFYLVESSHGEGHYVLSSKSPEGPFELISEKIDDRIDGSMFLDVDGQMVLMYAASSDVNARRFASDMKSLKDNVVISNTSMAGWTEGPEQLIKDGVRYYFYTGNGVTQRAYRIDYSYAYLSGDKTFDQLDTIQGHNLILNTDDDFYGLGHGCVIMGPDLDSYYMGYHNSYQDGNDSGRRFNLSRMLFNGTEINMQHVGLYDNIVPSLPDYQCFDKTNLISNNNLLLSDQETEDSFTVEYNFKGQGKLIFAFNNQNDYCYSEFDGRSVKLYQFQNNETKLLNEAKAFKDYSLDNLHSIRLGYKDGLMDVSFDYQEIANDLNVGKISKGKVGYEGFEDIGTLTFSNTAQGDSDKLTEKMETIPSNSYDVNLSKMSEKTKLIEIDDSYNLTKGSYQMQIDNPGDYVSYVDYAYKTGNYGLDMIVPSSMFNKKIGIQIDGKDIYSYTVPTYPYEGYVKTKIADLYLEKGNHNITIFNLGDKIEYRTIFIEPNYNIKDLTYEEDLKSYPEKGINYPTFFNKDDEGFYSDNNARYLVTFGNGGFEDLEMSVDIKITGENGIGTIGLVLSADNWAFNNLDLDNYKSIQGYYFAVNNNKVQIVDSNYQYTNDSCRDIISLQNDITFNLKAIKQGKNLKMYIDNNLVLETFSPLGRVRGYAGIYANNTSARFNNLKIKTL